MSDAEGSPLLETVLTPKEKQAVVFAQNLFGALAKREVVEFVEHLGLTDKPEATRLLGKLSADLEGMDWEERRETATKIAQINEILDPDLAQEVSVDDLAARR